MTGAPRPSSAAVGAASLDVVVVGSTNADLLVQVAAHPAPGETVLGRSMAVIAGGKGANQAVAAARSGARVAFVGSVGDDEFADPARAGLRANGVDLSGLRVVPGSTGIAIVTVSACGENSIVVIPRANAATDADAVRAQAGLLAQARVVVVQGEVPRDGIEEAARLARGRLIVNLAPVIALATQVLRQADPLVVNEHEAALAARRRGRHDRRRRRVRRRARPAARRRHPLARRRAARRPRRRLRRHVRRRAGFIPRARGRPADALTRG